MNVSSGGDHKSGVLFLPSSIMDIFDTFAAADLPIFHRFGSGGQHHILIFLQQLYMMDCAAFRNTATPGYRA